MNPRPSTNPYEQYALAQKRKKEFRRRETIIFLGGLPMVLAFVLWIIDLRTDWLEHVIADLDLVEWAVTWGSILLACAIFPAVLAGMYWRCPACERFLGTRSSYDRFMHGRKADHRCPHCDERLRDGGLTY